MESYFYNRDFLGGNVIDNLEHVLFERSNFPWKPSLQVFQSCLSNVFQSCLFNVFQSCLSNVFQSCLSNVFQSCLSNVFQSCSSNVFQSCLFNVFSCELCCPRGTLTHVFVSHYKKTPFSRSSLPVPATLGQIQNATAEEGRNETKECNVTVGTPLNVSWKNVKTGQFTKGKLLTIINVRRNQSGEYRCIANNTCGNESTGMFIDMHCKNLFKVFTWLSDVYYSMLVSVFYNCVLNHIAVISMLLTSQS